MRLTVTVEDIVVDIESEVEAPSFDTVETLLTRAADTAMRCWWEINGEDAEPLVDATETDKPNG